MQMSLADACTAGVVVAATVKGAWDLIGAMSRRRQVEQASGNALTGLLALWRRRDGLANSLAFCVITALSVLALGAGIRERHAATSVYADLEQRVTALEAGPREQRNREEEQRDERRAPGPGRTGQGD